MVTREQIIAVRDKLYSIQANLQILVSIVETALFEYTTNTTPKHLPQADIDALFTKYKTQKQKIVDEFQALP